MVLSVSKSGQYISIARWKEGHSSWASSELRMKHYFMYLRH